jgi:hypothetical protein
MAVDTRFTCANGRIIQRPSGTVEAVVDAVGYSGALRSLDASRSLGHGLGVYPPLTGARTDVRNPETQHPYKAACVLSRAGHWMRFPTAGARKQPNGSMRV